MNDETKQSAGSKFPLSAFRFPLFHCHRSQHQNRAWLTFSALISLLFPSLSNANPTGGSVAQGAATINSSGSQLTINQSSQNAFINWSSFDIGRGETTIFNQPSSSSVTWNQINDVNASQILGNLNANGFVVLQNQNGFYVGGSASISTHGLIMTTAHCPAPDLSSGGPWSFNTPPPTAQIVNYGQINVSGANPAFLIASDIVNKGTISASDPGGRIGLYAGQTVLVSASPDGRGLSTQVTLPQGSVDNEGKLIADAGSIVAQAKTVNQNGLVQANSVQNINGVIELLAGDSLAFGVNSDIEANGDKVSVNPSSGGFVVLKSGNTYGDTPTSIINVSGHSAGQNGIVEILGKNLDGTVGGNLDVNSIHSIIGSAFARLINPYDLTISDNPTDVSSVNPNLNVGDLATYSQIDLHTLDNIELGSYWSLSDSRAPARLNLTAGNNIILDDGAGIQAGKNWNLSLTAGAALLFGSLPVVGNGGIYLYGSSFLQTLNGNINLWAANEVQVGWAGAPSVNGVNPGTGSITTLNGGNISVTAQYGDVNTGNNVYGYSFGLDEAPYYNVASIDYGALGGISTAAGGDVNITAGGNVTSFLPTQGDYNNAIYDGGSGAFGAQPGNVNINAGGNVYGHYVVANGIGAVHAGHNVGAPPSVLGSSDADNNLQSWQGFALSLVKGSWNIYAPHGSIYLQDVRNPNGTFGESQTGTSSSSSPDNYPGYHFFDYDPRASVLLNAGLSVEIIGNNDISSDPNTKAPHLPGSLSSSDLPIPIIMPPSLQVITGAGDFVLDSSVILFPSPYQNLQLNVGGNLVGKPTANPINLEMSDSGASRWVGNSSYSTSEHAATPPEINNTDPVQISVSGNIEEANIYTTKVTHLTVGGDMINSGFVGQNMNGYETTTLNVSGRIFNSHLYSFAQLTSPLQCTVNGNILPWNYFFFWAINPNMLDPNQPGIVPNYNAKNPSANGVAYDLKINNYLLFPAGLSSSSDYGSADSHFVYDPLSLQLSYRGNMSASGLSVLNSGVFTVLKVDAHNKPIIDANGHLETTTCTINEPSAFAVLYAASQGINISDVGYKPSYQIGGPGEFDIHAGSIDLGFSGGISSRGFDLNYSNLKGLLPTPASGGAAVNVTVDGDLSMSTSTISSQDGGNVTVIAGGNVSLTEHNFNFLTSDCYGIYTSGHSDVKVVANGNIDVGNSRIASFDGGNVWVESDGGNVNAGNGANNALTVRGVNSALNNVQFGNPYSAATLLTDPAPYGSGILAEIPIGKYQSGGVSKPGNITVLTPHGDIVAGQGGISQFALNGSVDGGPILTLDAGHDINLGQGGAIGGTVNVTALGKITGLIVSRQDANISTHEGFTGTVLAGKSANFSGGGGVSGTVVGIGGINVSGGAAVSANLLSANVGGVAGVQNTLGTSVAASSTSQSAATQSGNATKQQLASNDTSSEDDDKKRKSKPVLTRIKRVTVLLPKAS